MKSKLLKNVAIYLNEKRAMVVVITDEENGVIQTIVGPTDEILNNHLDNICKSVEDTITNAIDIDDDEEENFFTSIY